MKYTISGNKNDIFLKIVLRKKLDSLLYNKILFYTICPSFVYKCRPIPKYSKVKLDAQGKK